MCFSADVFSLGSNIVVEVSVKVLTVGRGRGWASAMHDRDLLQGTGGGVRVGSVRVPDLIVLCA